MNRAIKFCSTKFPNGLPKREELTERDNKFIDEVNKTLKEYIGCLEKVKLRSGLSKCLKASRIGNIYFQDTQPWVLVKNNRTRCGTIVNLAVQLVYTLASILGPYMPSFSKKVLDQLNIGIPVKSLPIYEMFNIDGIVVGHKMGTPSPIFRKIKADEVEQYQKQFSGTK